MKKKDKIFTDESGEKWKVIGEKPCPRQSQELLKNNFKLKVEIEFELELTEAEQTEQLKPHTHSICQKVDSLATDDIERLLYETKEFGNDDCSEHELNAEPKIKIKVKESQKNFDLPKTFDSSIDRNFKSSISHLFRSETEYIEKHIAKELKRVFLKLWQESIFENSGKRENIISYFVKEEEKIVRQRFTKDKYKRDDSEVESEKDKFIQDCRKSIAFLKRKHLKKIYQKDVAFNMYSNHLDSAKNMFKYRMEKFQIDFKKLLADCEKE